MKRLRESGELSSTNRAADDVVKVRLTLRLSKRYQTLIVNCVSEKGPAMGTSDGCNTLPVRKPVMGRCKRRWDQDGQLH